LLGWLLIGAYKFHKCPRTSRILNLGHNLC
jgi:hypothetical protein